MQSLEPTSRISRRSILQAGALGLLGLNMGTVGALQAAEQNVPTAGGSAKSVIFIFLSGMNRQVRMARTLYRLVIAASLIVALPVVATAGLTHPASWKVPSQDGRFLLVMVSPLPVAQDTRHSAYLQAEILQIRKTYSQSGLYKNDGSIKPLWTLPYCVPGYSAHIASDGKHLVLFNSSLFREHLGFYGNGNQLAYYEQNELISFYLAKIMANRLVRRDMIDWTVKEFDPESLTFTVNTDQGEVFDFDITTGKIVRHWSPWPIYLGFPLAVVPVFVIGLYYIRPRLRTTHRRSHLQFSLRQLFMLTTVVCAVLWLFRFSGMLAVACSVISVVGGGIACLYARNLRAWLVGAILSLYGSFLCLLLWAMLGDLISHHFYYSLWVPFAIGSLGAVAGALLAGAIERRHTRRLGNLS